MMPVPLLPLLMASMPKMSGTTGTATRIAKHCRFVVEFAILAVSLGVAQTGATGTRAAPSRLPTGFQTQRRRGGREDNGS